MDDLRPPPAAPQNLLVTGVDGMLGGNLATALADRVSVLGLYCDRPVSLERCPATAWDPANVAAVRRLVLRNAARWIIHCGALGHGSWDVPPPRDRLEAEAGIWAMLAEVAERAGAHLTVISTDAVFAGPRMFHEEQSLPLCEEPRALAARKAERALHGKKALIVRTHAYGWGPRAAEPSFAERVWQALSEGAAYRFDPHRHATPILAGDLADLLWVAICRGLTGPYHIAGAERTSAYHFAGELATAFGLSGCEIASAEDVFGFPAGAPLGETSLDTRRARLALGRPMPMLREGLDRFAVQARNGFRGKLRDSAPAPALHRDAAEAA